MTYLAVDAAALRAAQTLLLLLPALPAGALAGEALALTLGKKSTRGDGPRTLVRGGVATMLIVALFVWLGSTDGRDVIARLLSPWCLIPTIVGLTQLGLGLGIRFRQM